MANWMKNATRASMVVLALLAVAGCGKTAVTEADAATSDDAAAIDVTSDVTEVQQTFN